MVFVRGLDRKKPRTQQVESYLKAQVENSLRLGWTPEDIVISLNFPFEHMGVSAISVEPHTNLSPFCNKHAILADLWKQGVVTEATWFHDLDVWELEPTERDIDKVGTSDLMLTDYGISERVNTGVMFCRYPGAIVLFDSVVSFMGEHPEFYEDEEAWIEFFVNQRNLADRWSIISATHNFAHPAHPNAMAVWEDCGRKIQAIHFHAHWKSKWKMYVGRRNVMKQNLLTPEVEEILRRHFW